MLVTCKHHRHSPDKLLEMVEETDRYHSQTDRFGTQQHNRQK